jgi:hypothetical protein
VENTAAAYTEELENEEDFSINLTELVGAAGMQAHATMVGGGSMDSFYVSGVAHDSRKVQEGDLFVCMAGSTCVYPSLSSGPVVHEPDASMCRTHALMHLPSLCRAARTGTRTPWTRWRAARWRWWWQARRSAVRSRARGWRLRRPRWTWTRSCAAARDPNTVRKTTVSRLGWCLSLSLSPASVPRCLPLCLSPVPTVYPTVSPTVSLPRRRKRHPLTLKRPY